MTEKVKNNIELISLHIPKTAGTTFRTILKTYFGKRHVARFDVYPSGNITLNEKPFKKKEINKKIKVLHGHFKYKDINTYLELDGKTPIITWVRDPVDLVVSNYYYLMEITKGRLNEAPDENLMLRVGKTLREFAQVDLNRNIMSRFIGDAPLDDFDFIGIQQA